MNATIKIIFDLSSNYLRNNTRAFQLSFVLVWFRLEKNIHDYTNNNRRKNLRQRLRYFAVSIKGRKKILYKELLITT